MKTAAISELKVSLSEYLSKVKAGEEVLVTGRGKPIARIVPLERAGIKIPPHLPELERAGLARIGTGRLSAGFWKLHRPKDAKGLVPGACPKEREEVR